MRFFFHFGKELKRSSSGVEWRDETEAQTYGGGQQHLCSIYVTRGKAFGCDALGQFEVSLSGGLDLDHLLRYVLVLFL